MEGNDILEIFDESPKHISLYLRVADPSWDVGREFVRTDFPKYGGYVLSDIRYFDIISVLDDMCNGKKLIMVNMDLKSSVIINKMITLEID